MLGYDRTDAEKDYEYAMTVLPQDETIFSKWEIIEAKINAGFAKEKIDFLANKGKVQKRIARVRSADTCHRERTRRSPKSTSPSRR